MFDANLLFFNGVAVTTTGTGGTSGSSNTKAATINKTPADGLEIAINFTAAAGSTTGGTIYFKVMGSADDSTYVQIGQTPSYTPPTALTRHLHRVRTDYKYIRLDPVVGTGTGFSATVYAGIVTGGAADHYN